MRRTCSSAPPTTTSRLSPRASPVRSLLTICVALWLATAASAQSGRFVVGSKNFTESRILGELIAQTVAAHTDLEVEHRANLGGTLLCWGALESGQVDAYPEYTGTAWAVVLEETGKVTDSLRAFLTVQADSLERFDVEWLAPFGFEDSYALVMSEARAAELGVRRISDLAAHPGELRAGFSVEYLNREDGWPGLRDHYGLELAEVRGMEHALTYDALAAGRIDLLDAYTTDAKLLRAPVRVLVDDLDFYPPYHAAPVVRGQVLRDHPELRAAFERLAFAVDEARMIRMNHAVEVEGRAFADVAHEFLVEVGVLDAADHPPAASSTQLSTAALLRLTGEHLTLTLIAVALASLIAIPLGIRMARRRTTARLALGFAAAVQTIPSLALLAFLIAVPGLGLSTRSAIFALTLYALLPILRNTHAGLAGVAPELIDAARGMGLTERQILLRVQLPLATRTILAGVRTATVISIGVATLAAFIGAGGLGEPILTGLYLNDVGLILSGAIPAAVLALVADRALGALERALTPRGLR
ncbi:MAG: ABC transporter permease subunit [Planctomycetes bacterium]|nr:ABC transporter permease subunit [Planctomycetota bacterium]